MGRKAKTSDDQTTIFSHPEILILIELWKHNYTNLTKMGCHQEYYEKIAEDMKIHNFHRTWQMCKNKIKNLKGEYKKKKPGVTGSSPSTWPYYNAVHEIMNRKASINQDLCEIRENGLPDDDDEIETKRMKTVYTTVVPYVPKVATSINILQNDAGASTMEAGLSVPSHTNVTNNIGTRETEKEGDTSSFAATTPTRVQDQQSFVSPGQFKRTERKRRSTCQFQERALEMIRKNQEAALKLQTEMLSNWATVSGKVGAVCDTVQKLAAHIMTEPSHGNSTYAQHGMVYPPMGMRYPGTSRFFMNQLNDDNLNNHG